QRELACREWPCRGCLAHRRRVLVLPRAAAWPPHARVAVRALARARFLRSAHGEGLSRAGGWSSAVREISPGAERGRRRPGRHLWLRDVEAPPLCRFGRADLGVGRGPVSGVSPAVGGGGARRRSPRRWWRRRRRWR